MHSVGATAPIAESPWENGAPLFAPHPYPARSMRLHRLPAPANHREKVQGRDGGRDGKGYPELDRYALKINRQPSISNKKQI